MGATDVWSRRRPFPYDAQIGNVKVLLEPDQDGALVSENSKTLDATAPLDYTYSSANPFKERTSEYQKLFGGFGQAVAPDAPPRRYWYAEKADLSVDGLWMKGPAFEKHVETVVPGGGIDNEIRQLIEASYNGVRTIFAICQKGIYRRVSDGTWVASLTTTTTPALGGGIEPQQAVRFKHRGPTSLDALYVTMSTGNLWRLPGTSSVWDTPSGAAGDEGPPADQHGNIQARYIEKVGDELWVAGSVSIAKVEDDPFVRANYSGQIVTGQDIAYIGDQSNEITWLRQIDDTLYTFKQDGVYTVDTEGLDHELFPTLRGKPSPYNGKNASVWIDRIWFTYGNQTFTLDSSGNLKPDGLEQMLENTSDVKGRWIGGAGHNTWFFYEVYYNRANDTSYLVKHGTWIEEGEHQETPGSAQFSESHHGALYDWDKRASCVEILSGISTESFGHDRLYVGFLDGTVQWTRLPQHSPNPAADRNCEFTDRDSYVYLPQHHSGFRADNKLWHAATVLGPSLTKTAWVEVQYKVDVGNPLASWYTVDAEDPQYVLPGQRHNLQDDEVHNPVYGRAILFRVKLVKASGLGYDNTTPVTEGLAIHESIRPGFSREFTLNVKLGSFLPKRDGTVDRRRAPVVQNAILQECAVVGPINVLLPTGVVESMTIVGYEDSALSRQKVRDHAWTMRIRAIQLRTITEGAPQPPPNATGLTYATLQQHTLGELEQII